MAAAPRRDRALSAARWLCTAHRAHADTQNPRHAPPTRARATARRDLRLRTAERQGPPNDQRGPAARLIEGDGAARHRANVGASTRRSDEWEHYRSIDRRAARDDEHR